MDQLVRSLLIVALTVLINWVVGVDKPIVRVIIAQLILITVLVVKYRAKLYVIIKTLPRDLIFWSKFVQCLIDGHKQRRKNGVLPRVFVEKVRRWGSKPCFFFEGKSWTFTEVNEYANRVAGVFQAAGYKKGDVVALMMGNHPEYVGIWLGLSKLGVITALINFNLRDNSLAHCLRAPKIKTIVFSEEFRSAVLEVKPSVETLTTMYQLGGEVPEDTQNLEQLMDTQSTEEPVVTETISNKDTIFYVYTSGTTGLPKPAIMTHTRVMFGLVAYYKMLGMDRNRDIFYTALPLYHTAGGVFGTGTALLSGVPLVISRKFSASRFWADCVKYKVTVVQYIGEMCRYLLAQPESPQDKQHHVRLFVGNGMRPAIWEKFVQRFNVPKIFEIYGATEGNVNLVNLVDCKVGAVGFLPRSLPLSWYPLCIVRVDTESGEPVRDPDTGFCIRCNDHETGMLIGKISDTDPMREYHGYVDKEASETKVMKDAFQKGDRYFMSGDLMEMDEFGYIYFKDRTGDTFRWKGENVSTTEVEEAMMTVLRGTKGVAVYGVEVPGAEGRTGMAAVADPDKIADLQGLAQRIPRLLPVYAKPQFIRVMAALPMTSTFKISKTGLQKEGYDLEKVKDPIYFYDGNSKQYVPLTQTIVDGIKEGRIRL